MPMEKKTSTGRFPALSSIFNLHFARRDGKMKQNKRRMDAWMDYDFDIFIIMRFSRNIFIILPTMAL